MNKLLDRPIALFCSIGFGVFMLYGVWHHDFLMAIFYLLMIRWVQE